MAVVLCLLGVTALRQVEAQDVEPDIAAIQQELSNQGFDPGPVDGLMGRRTRAAIAAFQTKQDLPATGELDADDGEQEAD